ncbi:hypothetical protein [Demequina litorisediminis]|uniref:hypothetical protein n=1 Tax=Demequina litorisediminis TaxID=1849022 RepID=UPI0024E18082|nr:hypothetical protein [Demequina litorisediminis]
MVDIDGGKKQVARSGIDPEIFKQVALALDPKDNIGLWDEHSAFIASIPLFRREGKQMVAAVAQMRDLHETAARSFEHFTPRGWGVTNIGVPTQKDALEALDQSGEAADVVLAAAIDGTWIDRPINRMKYVYKALYGETHLGTIGGKRWELVRKARALHLDGNYDAAIPLILNTIEGLVADSQEGKLFFTGSDRRMIDMIEPTTLVGMACSLRVLHALYKRGVNETTTECVMSRHGIMHGRVLGYGTQVASAKCWTLYDAVVDILITRQGRVVV